MSDKERILLVNKFYYPRGGDCIQMMAVERLLKQQGHEVAVFAMQYPANTDSEYSGYFPTQVDFSGSAADRIRAAARVLGYGGVRSRFRRMLRDFSPAVVHLHNIHSYLSPVVAEEAKRHGCRVVWTLHDYKLACPSYSCLSDGKPCEACFADKTNVMKKRCMKGSMAASIMAYIEAEIWNIKRLCRTTDTFICPSRFMAEAMIRGGVSSGKIEVLNNFIDMAEIVTPASATDGDGRGDYYCYVGRLSAEKGVETLLKAATTLPYRLKIAGTGPLADYLKTAYASPNIEFLGQLGRTGIMELLASARFSVMPSEVYENNPLGVIESLCSGTPVIGADIGGIPELLDRDNGRLFKPFSAESLVQAIEEVSGIGKFDYGKIATEARKRFSSDNYYKKITEIYSGK